MMKRGGGLAITILMIAGLSLYGLVSTAWSGRQATLRDQRAERPGSQPKGAESSHVRGATAKVVVFDLLRSLSEAKASVRTGRQERGCTWLPRPGRFRCGRQGWAFVGPHAGRSGGRATRCVWVHPQPNRATTILRWSDVAMGERVHARLALLRGSGSGKPVSLRVAIDGRTVGTTSAKDEWQRGELDGDVPPGAARGALRLEIDAANNRWRMACIDVWMTGRRAQTSRRPAGIRRRLPTLPTSPTLPTLPTETPPKTPVTLTPTASDQPGGQHGR